MRTKSKRLTKKKSKKTTAKKTTAKKKYKAGKTRKRISARLVSDSRPETNQKDNAICAEQSEITFLVQRVRDSDDDSSFMQLQKQLDYYIKMFSRKYRIPGCDADEIEQECLYALRYKAIEDFNPTRGQFKSFAVLCIKRHLFSLIKSNNQLRRRVLNTSISLDQDRNNESLSLVNLITEDGLTVDEQISKTENQEFSQAKLFSKLTKLEREVLKRYLQQMHYDEIADDLKDVFPGRDICRKTIDNALVRSRMKAQNMHSDL